MAQNPERPKIGPPTGFPQTPAPQSRPPSQPQQMPQVRQAPQARPAVAGPPRVAVAPAASSPQRKSHTAKLRTPGPWAAWLMASVVCSIVGKYALGGKTPLKKEEFNFVSRFFENFTANLIWGLPVLAVFALLTLVMNLDRLTKPIKATLPPPPPPPPPPPSGVATMGQALPPPPPPPSYGMSPAYATQGKDPTRFWIMVCRLRLTDPGGVCRHDCERLLRCRRSCARQPGAVRRGIGTQHEDSQSERSQVRRCSQTDNAESPNAAGRDTFSTTARPCAAATG
ncbi:MAG: hypothetical protein QM775_29605 [Pirellulales bacterium]